MGKTRFAAAAVFLGASLSVPLMPAAGQDTNPPEEVERRVVPQGRDEITLSFAPLVEKAAPAVVNIFTRKLVREGAVSPLLEEPIIERFFGRALPLFGERERLVLDDRCGRLCVVRSLLQSSALHGSPVLEQELMPRDCHRTGDGRHR